MTSLAPRAWSPIARAAGLGRKSLYKALSTTGNPEFATILKVTQALGLEFQACGIEWQALRSISGVRWQELLIGGAVTSRMRVTLEIGPKGKKVVAVAPDWPGLERGAKTGEEAIERLHFYVPRYSQVAKLAEMHAEFDAINDVDVVEQYPGTGSTDFWGISFAFSSIDKQGISSDELERELTLMQACWAFFDDVRRRVSAEMQKGLRGGGRDRDHIVRHTFAAEQDWAKMIGVLTPDGAMLTDEGLTAHRAAYCHAIRDYHSRDKLTGKIAKWPLRFLIRHTAFHTMDHAWEMEDKDLTAKET